MKKRIIYMWLEILTPAIHPVKTFKINIPIVNWKIKLYF